MSVASKTIVAPDASAASYRSRLQLGLAVSHHLLADAGHRVDRDQLVTAPRDVDQIVDVPLGVHPCTDAELPECLDGAPLEHTGPDPADHVLAAAQLEHDVVDAGPTEHERQQRPRRSCSDDHHWNLHALPSPSCPVNEDCTQATGR